MQSHTNSRTVTRPRSAFTLVELLVVIGIIAILASIVLSAVTKARATGREVVCQSNQRQIYAAFTAFAMDHDGQLPGNWWDHANPDRERRAWLINSGEPLTRAPQGGTVWRYLQNEAVYRCPATEAHKVGDGIDSNGRFDYAAWLVFSGARVSALQGKTARFTHPDGRVQEDLPVPLICEDEPQGGINGGNNEGGHCSSDRLSHNHRGGGSYYVSVDGSVHHFVEPKNADARNWTARSARGTWANLGSVPQPSWGWWAKQ